ncbi:MAG TPA: hypothetical protein VH415_14745 [Nitrososphaeraceae archaeon]|jgi:hypothetical protein
MEYQELCQRCKSDYLEPTDEPSKMICPYCGKIEMTWTLKEVEEFRPSGQL